MTTDPKLTLAVDFSYTLYRTASNVGYNIHNPGERHRLGSAELVSIMGCVAKGLDAPLIKATEGLLLPPTPRDATTQAKTLVQKAILLGIWRSGRLAREI